MERLLTGFSALSWREILFAAGMAYIITYLCRRLSQRKAGRTQRKKGEVLQTWDKYAVERCKELFPIAVLSFRGKEFARGTQIRVVTVQQKVIIGELIGLNRSNLVCIKTENQLVAHQLEKIAEVTRAE